MDKITISIDVSKVSKAKFQERGFFNKENKEVVITELKLDVIPLREAKLIKDGGDWEMWKTHFVAYPQTKDERETKQKSVILGDGIMFKKKISELKYDNDGVNPNDVPFL